MAQGSNGVSIAGIPMFTHGSAREFVVLDVALVFLLLIDEVDDVDVARTGIFLDQLLLGLAHLLGRDAFKSVEQLHLQIMDTRVGVGVLAGAAGISDVFLTRENIRHLAWRRAARAEEIHLKHQRGLPRLLFEQML